MAGFFYCSYLLPTYKQCYQWLVAYLCAPVAMYCSVEGCAFGQAVRGIEMFAGLEDTGGAILQANLHLPLQDEYPLGRNRAVKLAAEAYGAVS